MCITFNKFASLLKELLNKCLPTAKNSIFSDYERERWKQENVQTRSENFSSKSWSEKNVFHEKPFIVYSSHQHQNSSHRCATRGLKTIEKSPLEASLVMLAKRENRRRLDSAWHHFKAPISPRLVVPSFSKIQIFKHEIFMKEFFIFLHFKYLSVAL